MKVVVVVMTGDAAWRELLLLTTVCRLLRVSLTGKKARIVEEDICRNLFVKNHIPYNKEPAIHILAYYHTRIINVYSHQFINPVSTPYPISPPPTP